MSETIQLKASDGHELNAYIARPAGEPVAGLVVVQEAFGVNAHIRSVTDSYAKDGFLAVAPALFDRYERGLELGYDGENMKKVVSLMPQLDMEKAVEDTAAALDYVRRETGKKSGVIGYCLGGTMAWLSATRLHADAAVGYYGGRIGQYAGETPQTPVMLHFGRLDKHIPPGEVAKVQAAHPEVEVHWYDGADHGFNCDMRASYNQDAAELARQRSLAFLRKHLVE